MDLPERKWTTLKGNESVTISVDKYKCRITNGTDLPTYLTVKQILKIEGYFLTACNVVPVSVDGPVNR